MNEKILEDMGQSLVAHLQAAFPGYAAALREPLEGEVAPRQIWVSVDEIRVSEPYAAQGQNLTYSARLFVAVFYEVSKTTQHYLSVLAKRQLTPRILGGWAREANYGDGALEAHVEDENTLLTEGYFMSSTPVQLNWEVHT